MYIPLCVLVGDLQWAVNKPSMSMRMGHFDKQWTNSWRSVFAGLMTEYKNETSGTVSLSHATETGELTAA